MFNSREYEWADVTVIAGGRDLTGIRAVKLTKKIEREHLFAKGRKAHSIQSGNEQVEGEIALLQSEFIALQQAGKGSVLGLNIDITVSYGNPSQGDALAVKKIVGVRFTEESEEMKQGDKFQEIKLPFLALDVI